MQRWNPPMARNALSFGIIIVLGLLVTASSIENSGIAHAQETVPQQPAPARQPSEPSLMVAGKFTGVNEPEGIKLTSETSDLKHVFQIASITNKEVSDVRVEVAPFTGPNSTQTKIDWTINNQAGDKPFTVSGLALVPLELHANLPVAGAYTTTIWLIYDNKRWPIPLTVTRTKTPPTVEILGVEIARDSAVMASDASLWFTLHEKAGKQVRLYLPTVTSLALVQSDKTRLQAKYDSINVSCVSQDCKQENNFLVLSPGQTVQLRLTIVGLKDSGEFSGNLRVSGADGDPIDQAITLLRRRSGWLAGLLIALGVGISFLLRHYASAVRPRLILQREVLALKEDIDELKRSKTALTVDEQEVLDRLDKQTQDIADDITIARADNIDQKVKDIKSKVEIFPRWVQERGRVDDLKPVELQREFRDKLDTIKQFMNTQPITDELLKETRTTLDQIGPQIKVKVKEDLTNKIAALNTEVNTHRNSATLDIQNRLAKEVNPEISKVEALLKADQLRDARTAYESARLAFVRILGDELTLSLPAATTTPLGFTDPEWQQFRQEVLDLLSQSANASDPDEATRLYLTAYSQYLRGLISKLQATVKARQELIDQSASISPIDKAKHKQSLGDAAVKLVNALPKIDAGEMQGAAQDYEAARAVLVQVDKELSAIGGTMSTATGDTAVTTAAASPGMVPGPLTLPFLDAFATRGRTTTVREITRKLGLLDFAFTLVVLLIAVFLGLKLLWIDNATWGGWDAYLSAVLWGLGLHQVSGTAFEGLQGLAAKFGGSNTNVTT